MAKRYFIETYGCQMNVHDSERMAGLLESSGYEAADEATDADLVVINTCSVRERAEEKLFTRLGELRAERGGCSEPRPLVAVTGCVAQQEGRRILDRSPLVDLVVGTQALRRLPMLVEAAEARPGPPLLDLNPYEDVSFPLGVARRQDSVKAFVNIVEGCNEFCAFCVVPYTRGHERMRASAEIVADVRQAARQGHVEIHLLGQIVNHYQAPDDPTCDFAGLLARVHAIDGVERIRFASPHPRHVTSRLIQAIRDLPRVCKHLHLPVQSGSSRILKAMRRRHTRQEYLDLVHRLREEIPGICLSTDMIVGFPGETDEDFDETLSLTRAAQYHSMFSFKYSERPNTLASKRMPDDVPETEKTRRIVALQAVQRDVQARLHRQRLGAVVEVLVDSTSRRRAHELAGRTTGNTVVNFAGDPTWVGALVDVRITRSGPNSLGGEALAQTVRRAGVSTGDPARVAGVSEGRGGLDAD